jgi:hypothetical protein
MNPPSMRVSETRVVGGGRNTSETLRPGPKCGTFVRGTITGRVLTCGYVVGHHGDHQGTQHAPRMSP